MNRIMRSSLALVFGVLCLAGCDALSGVSDPTSNAPELAGAWCVTYPNQNATTELIQFDATGDPITYKEATPGGPLSLFLGVSELTLDGQAHSTSAGYDYAATGWASVDGNNVQVIVDIRYYAPGSSIQVASQQQTVTAQLTSSDKMEGTYVYQHYIPLPDIPVPAYQEGAVVATRGGQCP